MSEEERKEARALGMAVTKVGHLPVIGYLMAVTVRDNVVVPVEDYNDVIDMLADDGLLDERAKKALRAPKRKASEAYMAAIHDWAQAHDQAQKGVRYLVRCGKGGRSSVTTVRYLVREVVDTAGNTLSHDTVAELRYDVTQHGVLHSIHACPSPEVEAEVRGCVAEILDAYQRECVFLRSRLIRAAIARVIDDMCPLAYGSAGNFGFISVSRRSVVSALIQLVEWLNDQAGVQGTARYRRSEVSLLALPDLEDYRTALCGAFEDELEDVLTKAQAAVDEYKNRPQDRRNAQEMASVLHQMSGITAKANEHKEYAAQFIAAAAGTMDQLQLEVRRLIGLDTLGDKPSRERGLELGKAAEEFKIALQAALPDAVALSRYGEVVAWQRGFSGASVAMFCQDRLQDTDTLRLVFEQPPSADLQRALKLVKSAIGWVYQGPVSTDMVAAIVAWWEIQSTVQKAA